MTRRTPTGREPSKPNPQRMRCPERTVAERIADQEGWYYGAPERNRPGDPALARGAAFVAGLPEGAVLELRAGSYPWQLPPGVPRKNAKFPVRRKPLDPR